MGICFKKKATYSVGLGLERFRLRIADAVPPIVVSQSRMGSPEVLAAWRRAMNLPGCHGVTRGSFMPAFARGGTLKAFIIVKS
jgi:hypothetical protein